MSGQVFARAGAAPTIGEIVIDNAASAGVFSATMARQFIAALDELEGDDRIKAVLITAAGNDLCTGGDLAEIQAQFPAPAEGAKTRPRNQRARFAAAEIWWGRQGMFSRLLHCPKITILAAKGACLEAGLYLTLYADLALAAKNAVFGNPAWRHVGLNGDVAMLIAAVGLKRAKELIYLDARWNAAQACAHGLVDGAVAPDHLAKATGDLATTCAMIMRDAIVAEKQVVLASLARMQIDTGLAAAAVVAGWGTNIHFRPGEFNLLRAARILGEKQGTARGVAI